MVNSSTRYHCFFAYSTKVKDNFHISPWHYSTFGSQNTVSKTDPQNLDQKIERFINQWEITTSLKKAACAQLFAIFIMAHNLWA